MHVFRLVLAAIPVFCLSEANAQGSVQRAIDHPLCAQCPFDAPVRHDQPSIFDSNGRNSGSVGRDVGVISVRDLIDQLPDNIATVSPETTADSPFFLGASIANLRGLNTAHGVRTLTLIDSRRAQPEAALSAEENQDEEEPADTEVGVDEVSE